MAASPAPRTVRRRERGRARTRLLRSALELSAKAPFREITVAQIAELAGISRSAFYLHFGDKHELLLDALAQMRGEVEGVAEGWWSAESPPAEQVRDAVARLVSLYADNAEVLRLLTEVSTYDDEVRRGWLGLFELLVEAAEAHVRAEQRAGLIPAAVRAREVAEALVWMTERSCYLHLDRGAERLVAVQAPVWTAALYPGVIPAEQLRPATGGPGGPWSGEADEAEAWPPWEQGGTGAAS